jgi:hypothetical protein
MHAVSTMPVSMPSSSSRVSRRVGRTRALMIKNRELHHDADAVIDDANTTQRDRSRRSVLLATIVSTAIASSSSSSTALAAPPTLALYENPSNTRVGGTKRRDLSSDALRDTLTNDIAINQYFVTGKLTEEIFADDCRFIDPTTNVKGLSRYLRALSALFDPERSRVELVGELRRTSRDVIEGDYIAEGYLKLPWKPKVPRYEGHIVWTMQPDDGSPRAGLIVEQRQTWSISGGEALMETFTPSLGE